MKIPSAKQIKEIDAFTIADEGISSIELMERAAYCVTESICSQWSTKTPIVVFAGPGNNGGDALAVSRMLICGGYSVQTFLFNISGRISDDCQEEANRLKSLGDGHLIEITTSFEPPEISSDTLIVDGLFGTGLSRPLEGGFASLVHFINQTRCSVVSIDVPSGLMCENNSENKLENVIRASQTLTFQFYKLAFMFDENEIFVGDVKILDIKLSSSKINSSWTDYELLEMEDVKKMFKPRAKAGHKGTFGNAMIIAGQYGMAGAALLAGKACLRTGCGKVTLHTPLLNNNIIQIGLPEAIVHHDYNEKRFSNALNNDIRYDALCIGPGIGTHTDTSRALFDQLQRNKSPLVLDADALNILSRNREWLKLLPENTIITPHPAEFQRLTNCKDDGYSRLMMAKKLSVQYEIIIVLKGHHTAVCLPNGQVYFNSTGNSGMATAGSGDVLSGIIVSLLAQHYQPAAAALIAVYIHGKAGDLASELLGEYSTTASDIIDHISGAFQSLLIPNKITSK